MVELAKCIHVHVLSLSSLDLSSSENCDKIVKENNNEYIKE